MNETTTGESPLSLNDNSHLSVSTSTNSAELIEQMKNKIRELESENLALKRALPYLTDAKGQDATQWGVDLSNKLEQQKQAYHESQNKLADVARQYRIFRENAERHAKHSERAYVELKQKAEGLEQETYKLRELLRDEQSINYHLQHGEVQETTRQQQPSSRQSHNNSPSGSGRRSRSAEQFEECLRRIDQRSDESGEEISARSGSGQQPEPLSCSFHSAGRETMLAAVTLAMFDKLRSSADFFMELLTTVGEGAELQQDLALIERIKNMKLDLNKSIEMYNRRVEEYRRSAPTSIAASAVASAEHSFRQELAGTLQQCMNNKCALVETERDTLRAQLNREIGIKEDILLSNDELERNVREMRRHMEELRSELEESQQRVEDIQRTLQKTEEHFRGKYEAKTSGEVVQLNDKVRVLRQKNLEWEEKHADMLRAIRRFRELTKREQDEKDIQLQRQLLEAEEREKENHSLAVRNQELEQRALELERNVQEAKDSNAAAWETERTRLVSMVKTYERKLIRLRTILAKYEHYFSNAREYERLVEESTAILEDKIVEGQRAISVRASSSAATNHAKANNHSSTQQRRVQ